MDLSDAPGHKAVVLVAEDSTTVRTLVQRILTRAGFDVVEAADGIEAVTLAALHQPEVALLDIEMPGCDGREALRRIKANPRSAGVQVLMLTAVSDGTAVAEALSLGALDYVRKPCAPAELVARVRKAAQLAAEAADLRRRSLTDELTGLLNRRGIRSLLETLVAPGAPFLAVAIADCDHFKRINDRWGHEVGDAVLRTVAERLGGAWPTAHVGRWGGEEFLVVWAARHEAEATDVAERIRLAVGSSPVDAGPGLPRLEVTVSVGLALTDRAEPLETTLAAADAALYEAKAAGRNRCVVSMPNAVPITP